MSVRVLDEPPRAPLSWADVRCLEKAGFYDLAEIAAGYVQRAERRQRRRRWLCGLIFGRGAA